MADYKAGNLTLEFFGIDRSAEKTITNVVNKLNLLQRSLNVFQNVNATAVGKNLSSAFYNISRALGSINENDINKLSSLAKATNYLQRFLTVVQKSDSRQVYGKLNSLFRALSSSVNSIDQTTLSNIITVSSALSSLGRFSTKMTKLDFSKTETGFKNLAVAIQPFLEKVKEAEAGLSSLYGILQKSSGKKIQGLLGKTENKSGGLFGLTKIGFILHTARMLGRVVASFVQSGSDYLETLNLWQVAMRGNLDMADKFVNKVQKAYGISTQTIMEGQAVYKNMLGSLGQISDETATKISESLVLMTADYASLYNRSIKSAFQNMQSMLAGQVRPIRSAGLDITETTLYQYYQQIGGTKAMRQLTRTEKQLLSILAVYRQMGSAGALGDMGKTIDQFANQSRMLTENWKELKTWSGLILKDFVDTIGILPSLNATLITISGIFKAIAKEKGLDDENFLTGLLETAEVTNDAVDELQGKLLDFDKFRSLEGAETNVLGIDEKLLDALSNYSSNIDEVQSKAQKLAKPFLDFFVDDSGELTKAGNAIVTIFGLLAEYIGVIVGLKLGGWLLTTFKGLSLIKKPLSLSLVLIAGSIVAFSRFYRLLKDGDKDIAAVAFGIGTVLAGAFIFLHRKAILSAITAVGKFISTLLIANTVSTGSALLGILSLSTAFVGLGAAIVGAFFILSNWSDMSTWQKIVSIVGVATTAILGLAFAFGAFHSAWSMGIAAAGIVAGIASIVASIATVKKEASKPIQFAAVGASDIDSGTLFVAGEMGKTEAVYQGANGKTNVANVRQMEQAFYNALSRHSREGNGTIVVQAVLDGEVVYENTTSRARARGQIWAKA